MKISSRKRSTRPNYHKCKNCKRRRQTYLPRYWYDYCFVELGQDVHIEGGNLNDAINAGVAKGYTEGYLRKSVVAEPLFDRKNTQDNTPAVIYTEIVPGDKLTIQVEPKGFGSENKSGLKMLVPADGVKGVKKQLWILSFMLAAILAHQWLLVLVLAVLWTVLLLCLKSITSSN